MSKEKIVSGYYQPNITTARYENSTYTTKYAIDKLQQENNQLKEVIEEVREKVVELKKRFKQEEHQGTAYDDDLEYEELLQILDKVKEK